MLEGTAMQKTTICLPDEINALLQQLSTQTGRSPIDLIQTAIADYLTRNQRSRPRSVGMGNSGRSDLSERDEALLWQET